MKQTFLVLRFFLLPHLPMRRTKAGLRIQHQTSVGYCAIFYRRARKRKSEIKKNENKHVLCASTQLGRAKKVRRISCKERNIYFVKKMKRQRYFWEWWVLPLPCFTYTVANLTRVYFLSFLCPHLSAPHFSCHTSRHLLLPLVIHPLGHETTKTAQPSSACSARRDFNSYQE